jgi:hypothetical protein
MKRIQKNALVVYLKHVQVSMLSTIILTEQYKNVMTLPSIKSTVYSWEELAEHIHNFSVDNPNEVIDDIFFLDYIPFNLIPTKKLSDLPEELANVQMYYCYNGSLNKSKMESTVIRNISERRSTPEVISEICGFDYSNNDVFNAIVELDNGTHIYEHGIKTFKIAQLQRLLQTNDIDFLRDVTEMNITSDLKNGIRALRTSTEFKINGINVCITNCTMDMFETVGQLTLEKNPDKLCGSYVIDRFGMVNISLRARVSDPVMTEKLQKLCSSFNGNSRNGKGGFSLDIVDFVRLYTATSLDYVVSHDRD